jgi:hypothetical protein
MDFREKQSHPVGFNVRDRLLVDSGAAAILSHLPPSLHQHI